MSFTYNGNKFAMLLNGVVKHEWEIDLKQSLKNADGFSFFDGYTGTFTELRLWSSALTSSKIKEQLDWPLSWSFELWKNKGITMNGTQ